MNRDCNTDSFCFSLGMQAISCLVCAMQCFSSVLLLAVSIHGTSSPYIKNLDAPTDSGTPLLSPTDVIEFDVCMLM